MDKTAGLRIIALQAIAREDEYFKELIDEYETAGDRVINILQSLSDYQKDALVDFFGIAIAMHLRMLELALSD